MLSERNYPRPPGEDLSAEGSAKAEAERVHTTKVTTPPGAEPPAKALADSSPNARGLWQFNLRHPTLPGTVSVTVVADEANARGLAYLVAEEFCAQIIGQIKAT